MSDSIQGVLIKWTQAARKHRVGRASARYVITRTEPSRMTTLAGTPAWLWSGADERERELEIIAVDIDPPDAEPYLLVIHVMPTHLRG